jgi:hypothetical protein
LPPPLIRIEGMLAKELVEQRNDFRADAGGG